MCLYVPSIYLVGLHLQSQLGHEESHIFLCFSVAELCHSWSVLLVQVVPSNCFQGRTCNEKLHVLFPNEIGFNLGILHLSKLWE